MVWPVTILWNVLQGCDHCDQPYSEGVTSDHLQRVWPVTTERVWLQWLPTERVWLVVTYRGCNLWPLTESVTSDHRESVTLVVTYREGAWLAVTYRGCVTMVWPPSEGVTTERVWLQWLPTERVWPVTTFRECDYGVTILRRCDHRESVTPVVTHRVAGVCEAAAVWRVAVVRTRGHCTCYQHLAPTTPLAYIYRDHG